MENNFGNMEHLKLMVDQAELQCTRESFIQKLLVTDPTLVFSDSVVRLETNVELVFNKGDQATPKEQMEDQYQELLKQTMQGADLFFFAQLRQELSRYACVECHERDFDMTHVARLREKVTSQNVPCSAFVFANNLWSSFIGKDEFQQYLDPSSSVEAVKQGVLGHMIGCRLHSDTFRRPDHKVLAKGVMWALPDAAYLGSTHTETRHHAIHETDTQWKWTWTKVTLVKIPGAKYCSALFVHPNVIVGDSVSDSTFAALKSGEADDPNRKLRIDNTARQILHVRCGNSEWEPTQEELEAVCSLFESAAVSGGIVATRDGVEVESINLDPGIPAAVTISSVLADECIGEVDDDAVCEPWDVLEHKDLTKIKVFGDYIQDRPKVLCNGLIAAAHNGAFDSSESATYLSEIEIHVVAEPDMSESDIYNAMLAEQERARGNTVPGQRLLTTRSEFWNVIKGEHGRNVYHATVSCTGFLNE